MSKWGDKEATEQYKPTGGSGFWGKLEEGDNRLRLVSDYRYIGYHWMGKGTPSQVCLNQAKNDDKCPLCRQKKTVNGKEYPNTPNARFIVNCIDLTDTSDIAIRHYEFPYAVIDAINGYALDPDYKFDELPEWDMIINKEKKGEKQVDYTVRAARKNRPLTEHEQKLMEDFDSPADVVRFKLEKAMEEASLGDSGNEISGADEAAAVIDGDDEKPAEKPKESRGTTQAQADEINLDDIPF